MCEENGHDFNDVRLGLLCGVAPGDVIAWLRDDLDIIVCNLRDTVQPRLPDILGQGTAYNWA